MISDSIKQVDASNEPIKETHVVNGISNLSVGGVSEDPAVIGIVIIRQGITQGVINGGTSIRRNLVMDVLTDSSKRLFDTNTFQLNTLQSPILKKDVSTINDSVYYELDEHVDKISD